MKKKKTYFIVFLITVITICYQSANGQLVASNQPSKPIHMTSTELLNYRQFIWDSLPAAVGWVNDFAGLLKSDEENRLESVIAHFEKKTSIEIMIVTIDTNMVAKDKFKDFSDRLLKIWGIGKASKRNGIVITICSGYHETQISTDFGIDKYMGEPRKAQILKKSFIPFYEKNQFYTGTINGLDALIKELSKKAFILD